MNEKGGVKRVKMFANGIRLSNRHTRAPKKEIEPIEKSS